MVFSSLLFVFLFLALNLVSQAALRGARQKNIAMLLFSLVFFSWAGPRYVVLLLLDTALCWFFAICIEREPQRKKLHLSLCVALVLLVLGIFKYTGFLMGNLQSLFGWPEVIPQIVLPIGISFYTFQLISYVVDVYRGEVRAQKKYWILLLYASLFHQCIAGPIVRYRDVAQDLAKRQVHAEEVSRGISRFTVGLAKKAVLANSVAVLCVIGIFLPRPTESEIEKRKLTEFPAFTWESFWSGKWFSGIDTWYADTYPLRELLIGGNKVVQSLYGIRSDVIVGGENQGEEIPDIGEGQGELPTLPKDDPENKTDDPQQDNNTELPRDGNVSADGEMISGIFVSGNVGYGLYYFQQENSDWYAAILNEMDKRLAGKAQLYSLVAPINGGVLLSDSLQKELHISDQREAIRYIYSRMAADINGVEVFDALREHVDEYIYFHTDHHWTALGAYYAYTQYAKAAGLTPHMLDQFEQVEFPNFLGTYYSVSGITSLGANPDTVIAYKPMSTNKMKMTMADGTTYDWFVVNDVSGYGSSMKYGAFAGGDQPYSVVENPEITDGSACLVIKDSYGNALIPYLVDHYQYLYWIDFRYYKGSIYDLVAEKNIKDVLVLQQIYNTGDSGALKKLQALVER